MHKYKKEELKNLIEPFIYNQFAEEEYEYNNLTAKSLLKWNRLDLAFKLFYLDIKIKNLDLATEVYIQDIKAQTLGEFQEPGNDDKNSFDKYIQEFDTTFDSIKENGFDKNKTLIPLSSDGSIRNGAHRVASAIYLDKNIDCIKSDIKPFIIDYRYFYERNVSIDILEMVTNKFIEYADDVYLAFLWPSGIGHKDEAISKFLNIVYTKEIDLNSIGGFNLLTELYKHMDWSGNQENGYQGINQKLIECFPNFNSVRVIAFQAESLEKVREIKENVRQIYNIGFSSIHITDTKEEAIRISQLIFNENGLHFLNNASPYKYQKLFKELLGFKNFLKLNNIDTKDIVIDGSTTLNIYGIRESNDIDYFIKNNDMITDNNILYDVHDSELKYHKENKNTLIYNPNYYINYLGIKFVAFSQLYLMKQERNEQKDLNDCRLMNAFLESNSLNKLVASFQQKLFYMKIKLHKQYILLTMYILKKIGLYRPIKLLYYKMKGLNK